ncbi:helix-turn-helix domain-containing protein [Herbiconiux sp. KACC 21604]|uniref:TetR/AcrR family transcriptional regulator n=1 Tax=unclassified Herbiconiux TaxID=2618217 RepID=UPI0014931268|nr:TetR/AcrR family transcriptional regulator [Herbiconiux sp. SALV-R1]QJU52666.1 TetR/AcrR family transcriptional regulator [Herbiconiux sp. SALV-R1]WPO87562.1 helix-turn-helix domain-containing protein [Herbiconiux sp. KACC 21604]
MQNGSDPKVAILEAAARLLREHGRDQVTTRRVAEEAGTQPPALYRLFGDKDGLLEALADHVMAGYVASKTKLAPETAGQGDPLADLRASYRMHVEFGLANPELFTLMIDPRRPLTDAEAAGRDVLRSRVRRLAAAALLRVSEERAVEMISAAGNGAILCTLGSADPEKGFALGDAMLDAVLAAIVESAELPSPEGSAGGAATLRGAVSLAALTPELPGLSDAERSLLGEWLGRSIAELQR